MLPEIKLKIDHGIRIVPVPSTGKISISAMIIEMATIYPLSYIQKSFIKLRPIATSQKVMSIMVV